MQLPHHVQMHFTMKSHSGKLDTITNTTNASVNSSCAQHPPPQPRGYSRAFDTHAVSYQKITTQRILLGKKADWLICQGQEKLKRFVKACSWFYACISLLIEPELHSEIRSYRRESTFFGYWIKFLLTLFEKHPFIFIKLFITSNFTVLYNFNVNNFISIPKL